MKPKIVFQPHEDEWAIEFPEEGLSTSAVVSQVGERLYRLETMPIASEDICGIKDVIEADHVGDRRIRFCRVFQKSGWTTLSFVVRPEWLDRDARFQRASKELIRLGGYSELIFGGCLFIHVPPDVDWDELLRAADDL